SRERPAGEPLRIVVHPGQYFLETTLQLTARDAGLSIEAAQPGTTTLLGGRAVTGWEPDGERFYAADLPAVRAGTWDFRFLVVNGRLCDRARLPAEDGFEHENEWTVPWMSTTGGGWKRKPTEAELTTLQYRAGDLGPWLETRNAEVTVYHMWDESLVPVKAVDHATRTITFGSPAGHPPGAFGRKKYVVWNTREGLTQPGQWYLDRARGKVVYWPRPGEDMRQATALAPTLETLISIAGDNQAKARDITVRGLTLALTNTPCKAGGFGAGHYRGAIEAANAENLTLERLEIRHVGGQGMKLQNVNGSRITGCQVHHLGACGIRISGNDTTVSGCHLHNIGLAFPSAIALSAGGRGGSGLLLTDNVIHDTPYSGITCGGDNHRIERNLIYRCMRVLHDGAAIYVSMCRKIRIARNVARDIATAGPGYGASAYYLDEQAEECLVEDNVAVDVEHPSHNHMAWNNTLRGNVFVSSGNMKLSFAKSRDYTLTDNTLVLAGELAITTPEAIIAERGNRVFRGTAPAGAEAPLEILAALPLGAAPK
ncbi:MAG: right-handed parallel beta-helix repeat-containing protein, partial [Armatimonadetes bacterium]|nr:right-handed parallel beta-helix repeat-containing protein [Armatimonadota bacterium]